MVGGESGVSLRGYTPRRHLFRNPKSFVDFVDTFGKGSPCSRNRVVEGESRLRPHSFSQKKLPPSALRSPLFHLPRLFSRSPEIRIEGETAKHRSRGCKILRGGGVSSPSCPLGIIFWTGSGSPTADLPERAGRAQPGEHGWVAKP